MSNIISKFNLFWTSDKYYAPFLKIYIVLFCKLIGHLSIYVNRYTHHDTLYITFWLWLVSKYWNMPIHASSIWFDYKFSFMMSFTLLSNAFICVHLRHISRLSSNGPSLKVTKPVLQVTFLMCGDLNML